MFRVFRLLLIACFLIGQEGTWNNILADQTVSLTNSRIVDFYKKLVTANQTGKVFKLVPKDQYTLALFCTLKSCSPAQLEDLSTLIDFAKFEIKIFNYTNTRVKNNSDFDVAIEFIQAPEVERNLIELDLRKDHVANLTTFFHSEGDQKCRSLSSLRPQENLIKQIAIWVSEDLDVTQRNACLLMQMTRGGGMNTSATFSESWMPGGELSLLNAEQKQQFLDTLKALLSIHFGKNVAPGMNLTELNKVFAKPQN